MSQNNKSCFHNFSQYTIAIFILDIIYINTLSITEILNKILSNHSKDLLHNYNAFVCVTTLFTLTHYKFLSCLQKCSPRHWGTGMVIGKVTWTKKRCLNFCVHRKKLNLRDWQKHTKKPPPTTLWPCLSEQKAEDDWKRETVIQQNHTCKLLTENVGYPDLKSMQLLRSCIVRGNHRDLADQNHRGAKNTFNFKASFQCLQGIWHCTMDPFRDTYTVKNIYLLGLPHCRSQYLTVRVKYFICNKS